MVERTDLPFQGPHGVDGLIYLVEQPLALAVGVLELADDARNLNLLAGDSPAGGAGLLRLGLDGFERGHLFPEQHGFFEVLVERLDAAGRLLDTRDHDLFGDLLLVEDHHFLDVADAALQVFAESDDLAHHDRRPRDRLHHAHLAALDALGDLDLALAGQQGHRAHLAEVHADRVVGFFVGARGQVELDARAFLVLVELV